MSEVKVDTISERTAANGVAVDGVTIKDSGLTIPSGGTLTVASGGTITNSGTATGFGKVLQIQYLMWNTATSYTYGSYLSTGVTKSITPTSSSSKIIVSVSTNVSNSDNNPPHFAMYRDGSIAADLTGTGATGNQVNSTAMCLTAAWHPTSPSWVGVDSPATTSAVTYTMYIWGYSGTTWLNRTNATTDAHYNTNGPSSIILTEVSTG
jgi:hypothetical protein